MDVSKFISKHRLCRYKSREEYIQDIRNYIQEFRSDKEEELFNILVPEVVLLFRYV